MSLEARSEELLLLIQTSMAGLGIVEFVGSRIKGGQYLSSTESVISVIPEP